MHHDVLLYALSICQTVRLLAVVLIVCCKVFEVVYWSNHVEEAVQIEGAANHR